MELTWTAVGKAERTQTFTYGRDEKGREVGGYALVSSTFGSGRYELQIYATRNSVSFGASPPRSFFSTLDEAKAAAPAKLKAQSARYAKKTVRHLDGVEREERVMRCRDCGERGELTGHQTCQYPGRYEP